MSPTSERFWTRISRRDDDECWEWTGGLHPDGSGRLWWDGGMKFVHRLAYQLAHGPIPTGSYVRQTCSNRICANPAHLEAYRCVGADVPAAKLSEDQVLSIRRRIRGGESMRSLAIQHDVTPQNVRRIAHKQTWKHLP